MYTLSKEEVPPDQIEQLEDFARSVPPELRDLLTGLSRCLRDGTEIMACDPGAVLTPSQAAEKLGMSRTFLYTLMDRGELPHHRVGRDRRIRMSDIVAFEARRQASRRELAERFAHQQQTRDAVVDEIADLL